MIPKENVILGNEERTSIGIFAEGKGFLALTLTSSRFFKSRMFAEKWLARMGYTPEGQRVGEGPKELDAPVGQKSALQVELEVARARREGKPVYQLTQGYGFFGSVYIPPTYATREDAEHALKHATSGAYRSIEVSQ